MRGLNVDRLRKMYERVGITNVVNLSVADEMIEDYVLALIDAVK